MTREEMEELKGLAASMGLYDDKNPCKRAVILGKAIKALEQEPCEDAISRKQAEALFRNARKELMEQDRKEHIKDFNTRDLMLLNAEQLIHLLPPVKPQKTFDIETYCKEHFCVMVDKDVWEKAEKALKQEPKTGRWILAEEQNKEDVENDNYRFICSECQCSDIHAKGTKVPYCWKCGAKMVEPQEVKDET